MLLPAILIISPYSFLASHEFHETLIYFIIPFAAIAFFMGCRKHGDLKVLVMGILGITLLLTSLLIHEIHHSEQHSEEFMTVLITIAGSLILILSHIEIEDYVCKKILIVTNNIYQIISKLIINLDYLDFLSQSELWSNSQ